MLVEDEVTEEEEAGEEEGGGEEVEEEEDVVLTGRMPGRKLRVQLKKQALRQVLWLEFLVDAIVHAT